MRARWRILLGALLGYLVGGPVFVDVALVLFPPAYSQFHWWSIFAAFWAPWVFGIVELTWLSVAMLLAGALTALTAPMVRRHAGAWAAIASSAAMAAAIGTAGAWLQPGFVGNHEAWPLGTLAGAVVGLVMTLAFRRAPITRAS
jgi:hypothetical protein